MIATLTLNPAIDKNFNVPTLIPEVKMRCSAITAEPGGGGVNISKAIQELGGKVLLYILQEVPQECSCNN